MNVEKQQPRRFVVALVMGAVCAAIGAPGRAKEPVGRTLEIASEDYPVSLVTATTSDWSVVAWVARRPDGGTLLKAAWVPWDASVAGEPMTLAEDVVSLPYDRPPVQAVPRDEGSAWIVYAKQDKILARIVSATGPVGDSPLTLAAPDPYLFEIHASAQPDGGLLLLSHHQGRSDAINHDSVRAFDSQGIPVAREHELLGGWIYSKLAAAVDGGALKVDVGDFSEQGVPYQYLGGAFFDSDGSLLRGVQLTPIVGFIEDFDVIPAATGGYWVTWRPGEGGPQLRARRVWARGDPGRIRMAGLDPTPTSVAPTPDGGFLVSWVSRGAVFAQLHGKNGRRLGAPVKLASGLSGGVQLAFAFPVNGRGVVAWWGGLTNTGIFLTRFTVPFESDAPSTPH